MMMRRSIIIISSIVIFTLESRSQAVPDSTLAALEWLAFSCADTSELAHIQLRKLDQYISSGDIGRDAVDEMNRVQYDLLPDSLQYRFLWNASLLLQLNGDFEGAFYFSQKYAHQSGDNSAEALLLRMFVSSSVDSAAFTRAHSELTASDKNAERLDCICELAMAPARSVKPYVISSAILPGSGMIAAGYPARGITSMALHGGIALMVVTMIRWNVYMNAISWGITLLQKFYPGNLVLTSELAQKRFAIKKQKPAAECELLWSGYLSSHPLSFK